MTNPNHDPEFEAEEERISLLLDAHRRKHPTDRQGAADLRAVLKRAARACATADLTAQAVSLKELRSCT